MKTSHRRPGFRGSTVVLAAITAHPFATDSPAALTAIIVRAGTKKRATKGPGIA